jgi:single-strand DNA-binding protein
VAGWSFCQEHIMAFVRVEQRNAHLAAAVRLEYVNWRDGQLAKGTVTAISNTRRGSGEGREEEATAIEWTLWGTLAIYAAEYLSKGSHVNIVGRLRNNRYEKDGETVYGLTFTIDEIDYLDRRADSEARKGRDEWIDAYSRGEAHDPAKDARTPRRAKGSTQAAPRSN